MSEVGYEQTMSEPLIARESDTGPADAVFRVIVHRVNTKSDAVVVVDQGKPMREGSALVLVAVYNISFL